MPAEKDDHTSMKNYIAWKILQLSTLFFLIKQLRDRRANLTKNSKVSTILIIIVNLWISGHCRKWL